MEPESSLPCLQGSATGPYPKPDAFSPHLPTLFPYYLPIYAYFLPSGLFLSGFPTQILYAFLISPTRATCPAHIILHFITLIKFGEAPYFAVFSSLPPLPPSYFQIVSSAPCFETPSTYAPPLV